MNFAGGFSVDSYVVWLPDKNVAKCLACAKQFGRKDVATRHAREQHTVITETYTCHVCNKQFFFKRQRNDHLWSCHGISVKLLRKSNWNV